MTSLSFVSTFTRVISIATLLSLGACVRTEAQTATDPLASWNDAPAKQAIVAFVTETNDSASAKFVPPGERIATFDQDGTSTASGRS